ncbi:hypothetical protein F5148DRAFT_294377 [Russula earlei]|uniref:Uncharacterized protein n=1 Tax=Russula earlei TaxID=71964 RepID=A0ACC0UP22_9AGAM|nr:hypothetical protein F5148DRAFT_294377 [Russula earlei]
MTCWPQRMAGAPAERMDRPPQRLQLAFWFAAWPRTRPSAFNLTVVALIIVGLYFPSRPGHRPRPHPLNQPCTLTIQSDDSLMMLVPPQTRLSNPKPLTYLNVRLQNIGSRIRRSVSEGYATHRFSPPSAQTERQDPVNDATIFRSSNDTLRAVYSQFTTTLYARAIR